MAFAYTLVIKSKFLEKGASMLPLIDIEQVNQKSVIKTSNAQNVSESEGGGFAEIFNFLSMDKNSKKSETKSKKTSIENFGKSPFRKFIKLLWNL